MLLMITVTAMGLGAFASLDPSSGVFSRWSGSRQASRLSALRATVWETFQSLLVHLIRVWVLGKEREGLLIATLACL